MNFKSYKNFCFQCLANAELKFHREVLKNLFHNMTLKKHMWPLSYHHILAAGKLEALTQIRLKVYYKNAINVRYRDWDQVYLWTSMALKEFIYSLIFLNIYISVNAILECFYLFFGWEITHPLSTYATGGIEGVSKMCTGAYRGGGELKSRS